MTFHQACVDPVFSELSGPTGWTRFCSSQRVNPLVGASARGGRGTLAGISGMPGELTVSFCPVNAHPGHSPGPGPVAALWVHDVGVIGLVSRPGRKGRMKIAFVGDVMLGRLVNDELREAGPAFPLSLIHISEPTGRTP